MKKLAVLASFALATSAMAMDSKMDFKGRFDYQNVNTKTNNGTTTVKDSKGEYKPTYLRMATSSKLNDTVSGKLTLDFTDSAATKENGVSQFVEEAFLTKSFGMGLSAMIGKQGVLVGGRENDWSGRDMYTSSEFNAKTDDSSTGLTVGYEVAGQTFYVQHLETNSDKGSFSDRKITGLAYYGNFMDGMIAPIVSYHRVGTARSGQYDVFTAAGVQFKWNMIVAEFDYLMLTQENGGTTTTGAVADAEMNSMVAHVRYNHDMFRPFFKFMKDSGEKGMTFNNITVGNGIEAEKTGWELGLEYVPNKDEDFRYHVVYASNETKETTGTVKEKYTEDKIFAGVAFAWNVLK